MYPRTMVLRMPPPLGTTAPDTTPPVFQHGQAPVVGQMMVEGTYEVFNTNGTYYHGPAPVLALTFPAFHPPFRQLNSHLPHPHSFFDSNTCIIWPHISLSVITPKTVYYLINIVVKTQTSPPASSIADLLNGMCPLGNISYFLLVFPLWLVSY